jgi:hypothetical protein
MPGTYALLIDEDTTIASGSDSEEYAVHITATGMDPVTRTIELYRREVTTGNQLLVDSSGRVDVAKIAGTTQTARDIGASVLVAGDFSATMKTSLNAATPAVTVSDKTGFSLASGGLAAVTAWTVAITGNITGNLSGSVGSVTGLTASNLDATISSRLASASYTAPDNTSITAIKAKTDNLPASPAATGDAMTLTVAYDAAKTAAQAGDAMTLTSAYDTAKTAASQTSVDDLPTNAELATALATSDDATLAAIAALPTTSTIMPADIKKVNGVTVNGDGAGTPWGP